MKNGKNLILNKKYSEKEYGEMMEKIKKHMLITSEWGKPFPATLTPWPYNITAASEYYPLTKEQALGEGFMWNEDTQEAKHFAQEYKIPDNMDGIDQSVCNKILICEKTGRNYKIIPQEFKFYKTFSLPLPRVCPDQRYKELLSLQPPKKLRGTNCYLCNVEIQTVYPEKWGYKVICEKCYLKDMY
jgi:hypothetical protein